jgi:RNA polymerase sigma-32 factor
VGEPFILAISWSDLEPYILVNHVPVLALEESRRGAPPSPGDNDIDAAGQLMSHLRAWWMSIARQYLGFGLPHVIRKAMWALMSGQAFDPIRDAW